MFEDKLRIIITVIFQSFSYLTVPTLLAFSLSESGSEWFCLAGIVSTVLISTITSNSENPDEWNIFMQFVFWLMAWGMLGWFQSMFSYTGTSGTFMIVEGARLLFPLQYLPAWLGLIIIVTISFWSIVFLEFMFYHIIGRGGGDLGVFGRFHTAIWEWAWYTWTEVREFWDAVGKHAIETTRLLTKGVVMLTRICGVRDHQVADEGGHPGGPVFDLQARSEASSPPPYSVSHYIFLSCILMFMSLVQHINQCNDSHRPLDKAHDHHFSEYGLSV